MADRRVPQGRGKVKRPGPNKTEQKRRELVLQTAREVGREVVQAVFSDKMERARLMVQQEERARLMNAGARLMLERLLDAGVFPDELDYAMADFLEEATVQGGYQALEYNGRRIYPLDVDPETL